MPPVSLLLFCVLSVALLAALVTLQSSTQLQSLQMKEQDHAVIVTLVTGSDEDIHNLCRALASLQHLPDAHGKKLPTADVIVFHEHDDVSDANMWLLRNCAERTLNFAEVNFTNFPPGFDPEKEDSRLSKRTKWGYSQMIRFFVSGLWKHPAIKGYDIIMRLDSDACWRGANKKRFRTFHYGDGKAHRIYPHLPTGYVYQRNVEKKDKKIVCEGIYTFVANHIKTNNIAPTNRKEWARFEDTWKNEEKCLTFYNNFEIVRAEFMRQPAVQRFHEAMTETEPFGVFRYRWGDAIVRFLTIALFAEPDAVLFHDDLHKHYSHPCDPTW
jgi:hypothetical protein